MFSRKRGEKTMEDRLANEILDAAENPFEEFPLHDAAVQGTCPTG